MKYSLNTYVAATCLLLVVLSLESAAGAVTGNRKETCRLLNKADSFVTLSDDSSTCVSECDGNRAECKCKDFGLPTKPYPSLTQCYKWNQNACCKAGHDAVIKSEYSSLLSDTCIRNYPDLEFLYCLGCHNKQFEYVDVDAKKIYVCKDFAKKLWKASYDQCGINLNGVPKIPKFEFYNVSTFLNHPTIKPPFFKDYTIDTETTEGCLDSWGFRQTTVSTLVLLAVFLVQGILM